MRGPKSESMSDSKSDEDSESALYQNCDLVRLTLTSNLNVFLIYQVEHEDTRDRQRQFTRSFCLSDL